MRAPQPYVSEKAEQCQRERIWQARMLTLKSREEHHASLDDPVDARKNCFIFYVLLPVNSCQNPIPGAHFQNYFEFAAKILLPLGAIVDENA